MTDRIPLDDLTSDAYDALHAELDNLRLAVAGHDAVSAAWARKHREQQERAEQAKAERDDLARQVESWKTWAESLIDRVRRIHNRGTRTNTCNDCGQPWPCEVTRALAEPAT